MEIPDDVFRPQAERRVRLGLVVAELVRANNLQATMEQIKAHVEELAASYERPAEVQRCISATSKRLSEVEALVLGKQRDQLLAWQSSGHRKKPSPLMS